MSMPSLPPEWVQKALRAEVEVAFGVGVALTFLQGRAPVVVTTGAGRFTVPMLRAAFGDGIEAGDALDLELFWQPVDGAERAAQQRAYGSVLDYEAFAAQTTPLYRAWRFTVSHFPFGPFVLQSARWDTTGLTVQLEGRTFVFRRDDWFGETRPDSFGRAVRAKLVAEGLMAAECRSPVQWLGRFRDEYLCFAREIIFGADQAARGRVNVEVLCQEDGCGLVSDRFRQLLVWQDAKNEVRGFKAGVDRPSMPALMHGEVEGVKLIVAPFRWNQCPVTVVGKRALGSWFNTWFTQWFEGEQSADGKTLVGVIHSVSCPVPLPHESGLTFTVDFGSAPVEAAARLMAVLAKADGDAQAVVFGAEPDELTGFWDVDIRVMSPR